MPRRFQKIWKVQLRKFHFWYYGLSILPVTPVESNTTKQRKLIFEAKSAQTSKMCRAKRNWSGNLIQTDLEILTLKALIL